MRWRSTQRSRTTGNLLIGSSEMVPSSWMMLAMSAEQLWRTRPLMTMVHEPQTSSRQPLSHATGVVEAPATVFGFAAIHCSTLMTLAPSP